MGPWLASPFAILWITITLVAAAGCAVWLGGKAAVVIVFLGAASLTGLYRVTSIPLPADISVPQGSVVYDRDGKIIGSYSDLKRIIIEIDELPRFVTQAMVAAEDRSFYDHGGVSLPSILRASLANLRAQRITEGGSTITQQYVKNAVLKDSSRTWTRKIREAVLAVKLEDRYTKPQIIEFYLNTIYFGRGVYGIEAAARTYFDKSARSLSLPEAAFLASIVRAPELLQPDEKPSLARQRRDNVLRAMGQEHFISKKRAEAAAARPLSVSEGLEERSAKARAAYFLEWIRRGPLEQHFGSCLYRCGLQIHTTLDLDIQRYAERAIGDALPHKDDPEAALVAMTPEGEVLAFVGGRSSTMVAATGFNLASGYPGRHAGSALKPFTLLAALEAGVSPAVALDGSSPRLVDDPACHTDGKKWRVHNYGGSSYGTVNLTTATAYSVNTAYAQLAEMVGPEAIARILTRFGFDRASTDAKRTIPPLCSLALGALDVTPLEMTRAYAGLAAEGALPPVTPVSYVADQAGHCIKEFLPDPKSHCDESLFAEPKRAVLSENVSSVNDILQDVVRYGTGSNVDLPVVAAAKTGTSQSNTDAWFAGYTSDLVATVWLGYPLSAEGTVPQMRNCGNRTHCRPVDGVEVTGGSVPAEIWESFMRQALAELDKPDQQARGSAGPSQTSEGHTMTPPPPRDRKEKRRPEPSKDAEPDAPPLPDSDPGPGPLPIPLPNPTKAASGEEETLRNPARPSHLVSVWKRERHRSPTSVAGCHSLGRRTPNFSCARDSIMSHHLIVVERSNIGLTASPRTAHPLEGRLVDPPSKRTERNRRENRAGKTYALSRSIRRSSARMPSMISLVLDQFPE